MRRRIAAAQALIAPSLVCLALLATAQVAGPAAAADLDKSAVSDATDKWWEADIWRDPERGFFYYPPERARAKPRRPEAPKQPAAAPRPIKEITDHDELKAERDRRLKVAIMAPTPENMSAYLEANTYMMQKSAMFSDMWRRTVWSNAEFDFNVQNPNANFAQVELRQARTALKNQTLKDIGRDFGLLFFYRADCSQCKLQAPVLRMLGQSHGIEVLPVSLDGGPLEGWPEARPDNGISTVVSQGRGVAAVPTLYLVSRDTRRSVMLGSGVLAADEIIDRVHVLTQLAPGEDVAGGIR